MKEGTGKRNNKQCEGGCGYREQTTQIKKQQAEGSVENCARMEKEEYTQNADR